MTSIIIQNVAQKIARRKICQALSAEQIHNHTQHNTHHNTAHNGEVEAPAVFAFDYNIAGQIA